MFCSNPFVHPYIDNDTKGYKALFIDDYKHTQRKFNIFLDCPSTKFVLYKNKLLEVVNIWTNHVDFTFNFLNEKINTDFTIGFLKDGDWSFVGTDCLNKDGLSMNIESIDKQNWKEICLHEFGHFFGLLHEHQREDCDIDWDFIKIYDTLILKPLYTNNSQRLIEDIKTNFKRIYLKDKKYTEYDKDSIMHYYFSKEFYKNENIKLSINTCLSKKDIEIIKEMYPLNENKEILVLKQKLDRMENLIGNLINTNNEILKKIKYEDINNKSKDIERNLDTKIFQDSYDTEMEFVENRFINTKKEIMEILKEDKGNYGYRIYINNKLHSPFNLFNKDDEETILDYIKDSFIVYRHNYIDIINPNEKRSKRLFHR